jgi:hypothetical protein
LARQSGGSPTWPERSVRSRLPRTRRRRQRSPSGRRRRPAASNNCGHGPPTSPHPQRATRRSVRDLDAGRGAQCSSARSVHQPAASAGQRVQQALGPASARPCQLEHPCDTLADDQRCRNHRARRGPRAAGDRWSRVRLGGPERRSRRQGRASTSRHPPQNEARPLVLWLRARNCRPDCQASRCSTRSCPGRC